MGSGVIARPKFVSRWVAWVAWVAGVAGVASVARVASVAAALGPVFLGGCAAASTGALDRTLHAYAGALQRQDAEAAWSWLDEDARMARSFEAHRRLMAQNRAELGEVSAALRASAPRVQATARVILESGETVLLSLEDGVWRLDGGVMGAAGLARPLDAVAAFRRALMRRDLVGLEAILSRRSRAEWAEEVRRWVESTADPDDLEVEVQDRRARVRTSDGRAIDLVRESGEWRIADVDGP